MLEKDWISSTRSRGFLEKSTRKRMSFARIRSHQQKRDNILERFRESREDSNDIERVRELRTEYRAGSKRIVEARGCLV